MSPFPFLLALLSSAALFCTVGTFYPLVPEPLGVAASVFGLVACLFWFLIFCMSLAERNVPLPLLLFLRTPLFLASSFGALYLLGCFPGGCALLVVAALCLAFEMIWLSKEKWDAARRTGESVC